MKTIKNTPPASTPQPQLSSITRDAPGSTSESDSTLGTGQYALDRLFGWITGVSKQEALRKALLDWLKGDRSFEYDFSEDEDDRKIIDSVGHNFNYIVAGHTHLARAIQIGGGCTYFNSGTWIRLIRFTESMLASEKSFEPVYKSLKDGQMSTLDQHTGLILDRTTAVHIHSDSEGKTIGRLLIVQKDGSSTHDKCISPGIRS